MSQDTVPQANTAETTLKRPRIAAALRAVDWRQYVIYIVFGLIFLSFAVTLYDQGFLSSTNLLNIVRQTATISVMAVAVAFVIGAAEIDLSTGSTAGLSSVAVAMAVSQWGVLAGIAAGLAVGVIVGTINGGLVTLMGIPSFLVTLGMLGVAYGVAWWITDGAPQPIVNDTFANIFGSGNIGPVPSLVIWTLVFVIVGAVVLRKTRYGRQVLATGGNRTAAEYSGINTKRIKFLVLLVSAVAASIAGMLYAGWLQSGRFQLGEGDELSVIAAVILGGANLYGGRASVVGALFGSLMVGLINNGLLLFGLEVSQQQIVRGAIIIFAVALASRK